MIRAGHLAPNVRALQQRLAPKVERAERKACEYLLEVASALVPKDTMALHDSGDVRQKKGGLESEFIVGYGSIEFDATGYGKDRMRRPPHMYAFYVHQMQFPFLSEAVTQAREHMAAIIREEMQKKA